MQSFPRTRSCSWTRFPSCYHSTRRIRWRWRRIWPSSCSLWRLQDNCWCPGAKSPVSHSNALQHLCLCSSSICTYEITPSIHGPQPNLYDSSSAPDSTLAPHHSYGCVTFGPKFLCSDNAPDVNLDNILFSNARLSSDQALEAFLATNPAEMDPEKGASKSQPLPHEWTFETSTYEAERMTVALIDYGHS